MRMGEARPCSLIMRLIWSDGSLSPPQISAAYTKDAFHRYIVCQKECINPLKEGTKACLTLQSYRNSIWCFPRLAPSPHFRPQQNPLSNVDAVVEQRKTEADTFYQSIQNAKLSDEDQDPTSGYYRNDLGKPVLFLRCQKVVGWG